MRHWAPTAALLLMIVSPVRAVVIFNLSTGYNNATNTLLAGGVSDPKYVIAAGGTGGHIGETPRTQSTVVTGWVPDNASAASRWIVLPGSGFPDVSVTGGTYFFQTSFNIESSIDPSLALISNFRYAADNQLFNISVNGTTVWSQAQALVQEFGSFHGIANMGLGTFVTGQNTIRFDLYNQDGPPTPMGLRIEGLVSTVPEPATFLSIVPALNVAWLVLRGRRSARRDASA